MANGSFIIKTLLPVVCNVNHFQDDLPKSVNELLVFVAYFCRFILSTKSDLSVGALELLYKQGGHFSEVNCCIIFF